MGLRQLPTCRSRGLECDPRAEYRTLFTSPDGKVFEVLRWRCSQCGGRTMSAERWTASPSNPAWMDDADVQANF